MNGAHSAVKTSPQALDLLRNDPYSMKTIIVRLKQLLVSSLALFNRNSSTSFYIIFKTFNFMCCPL